MSSSCCGVREGGQCSRRKGPGKGRSPAAARAPLSGPGREGRRLHLAASSSFGPRRFRGYTARHPGPSAVSRVRCSSLNAPFLDPRGHQRACTGKRPVSQGEAHSAYNSGGDEAPFTSGVPHHTPPDLAVFSAPPLSHTHSRREPGEGRRLRDGEMLIIRGEAADSSHSPPPKATSPSSGRRPHRSATFLNQAPAVGVGGAGIPLRATLPLAPRRNRDRETGF